MFRHWNVKSWIIKCCYYLCINHYCKSSKHKTSVIQVYCINNTPQRIQSILSVWRSQIIITCCDNSSPNWQYTNMANKNRTYTSEASAISLRSPQLCQMKHITISGYSVKPWAYEYILHHPAPNSVEEGVWLIKANESQSVIETNHSTS